MLTALCTDTVVRSSFGNLDLGHLVAAPSSKGQSDKPSRPFRGSQTRSPGQAGRVELDPFASDTLTRAETTGGPTSRRSITHLRRGPLWSGSVRALQMEAFVICLPRCLQKRFAVLQALSLSERSQHDSRPATGHQERLDLHPTSGAPFWACACRNASVMRLAPASCRSSGISASWRTTGSAGTPRSVPHVLRPPGESPGLLVMPREIGFILISSSSAPPY